MSDNNNMVSTGTESLYVRRCNAGLLSQTIAGSISPGWTGRTLNIETNSAPSLTQDRQRHIFKTALNL